MDATATARARLPDPPTPTAIKPDVLDCGLLGFHSLAEFESLVDEHCSEVPI
jgi:hypothetical protein